MHITSKFLPGSNKCPEIISEVSQNNLDGALSAKTTTHHICRLNKLGYIPVVSTFTGIARTLAALVHIISAIFKTIIDRENKKFYIEEMKLGGKNIGYGLIESIPLIGNIARYLLDRQLISSVDKKIETETLQAQTVVFINGIQSKMTLANAIKDKLDETEILDNLKKELIEIKNEISNFKLDCESQQFEKLSILALYNDLIKEKRNLVEVLKEAFPDNKSTLENQIKEAEEELKKFINENKTKITDYFRKIQTIFNGECNETKENDYLFRVNYMKILSFVSDIETKKGKGRKKETIPPPSQEQKAEVKDRQVQNSVAKENHNNPPEGIKMTSFAAIVDNITRLGPPPGIPNIGNTCYMNSCLQAMFNVPYLVNELLNYKPPENELPVTKDIREALIGFYAIWKNPAMKEHIGKAAARVRDVLYKNQLLEGAVNRQQDAQEVLTYFLDSFGYVMSTKVNLESTDNKPKTQVTKEEPLQKIELEMFKEEKKLPSLIERNFIEEIEGDWREHSKYKKSILFQKVPEVVAVTLKRYKTEVSYFGGPKLVKNKADIEIPDEIDLNEFVDAEGKKEGKSARYRLLSYFKQGGDLSGGHYTANVLNTDSEGSENWHHTSDSDVGKAKSEQEQRKQAYVLFYERIKEE